MTSEPHQNLTITINRRNQFSTLRLAGSVPRRIVQARHVHMADRARVVPAVERSRRSFEGSQRCVDRPEARRADGWPCDVAWPFDVATDSSHPATYGPTGAAPATTIAPTTSLDVWA